MKYINAKNLLPDALVKELQSYIQGGYLYVPSDQAQQKRWGEASGYRQELQLFGSGETNLQVSGVRDQI